MYNYSRIVFKDNETPLNATTMNHLDTAINRLATHSLFPSDIIPGDGINVEATDEGKVKISQKSDRVLSVNINRLDLVYRLPEDASAGEIYLLVSEETGKLQGIYWGTMCLFEVEDKEDEMD